MRGWDIPCHTPKTPKELTPWRGAGVGEREGETAWEGRTGDWGGLGRNGGGIAGSRGFDHLFHGE